MAAGLVLGPYTASLLSGFIFTALLKTLLPKKAPFERVNPITSESLLKPPETPLTIACGAGGIYLSELWVLPHNTVFATLAYKYWTVVNFSQSSSIKLNG
jgi:hypothetical protein